MYTHAKGQELRTGIEAAILCTLIWESVPLNSKGHTMHVEVDVHGIVPYYHKGCNAYSWFLIPEAKAT